jgi:CTP synthase (UTP-ammonia lyase)
VTRARVRDLEWVRTRYVFGTVMLMTVNIALVGDENNNYSSHRELNAARAMFGLDVETEWVPTGGKRVGDLRGFSGIWLTPGSPYADDSAAYGAARWARENDVPFLGTCSGLQYAVIEYFRNVLYVTDASHAESDGSDGNNVIHQLACSLEGEERLVRPVAGTRFAALVNGEPFTGMHYCNYGPGQHEIRQLADNGMVIEATADDASYEVIELPANQFFMLTLFQPQIGASAGKPLHPLLNEFVRCARQHANSAPPLMLGPVPGNSGNAPHFGDVQASRAGAKNPSNTAVDHDPA